MTLDVRRAAIADIDALLPLVSGYRSFYRQRVDERRERAFITQHLANGTSVVFIGWNDARAVGFIQLFPTFSTVHLGPGLILEDLFVEPDARGAGVATQLLDAANAYAREIGAVGMFLETAMDNATAQRVYERNGWHREGLFVKYNAPL